MMMVKKLKNNVMPMVVYGDEEAKTYRSSRKEVSIIEKNGGDLDSSRIVEKE